MNFLSPIPKCKIAKHYSFPAANLRSFPALPPACSIPATPVFPAGLIPTFKKGFAPRVGFAWDPTGSAKWLVTSAYGIFYEPYYTGQGGPLQSPISAPPYLQTEQISTPNFADPFNGNPPVNGQFATPLTNLTLDAKLPLPVYPGLRSQHPALLRRQPAAAGRLRRHERHQAPALYRRQSSHLYSRCLHSEQR